MSQIVLVVALPLLAAFLLSVFMRAAVGFGLWIGPAVLGYGIWTLVDVWSGSAGSPFSVSIGGFAPPLGINFYVDSLALLFALAVQVSGLLFWPFKLDQDTARRQSLMLLLVASSTGLALSGDLFNLYVFYELAAVASFGLAAAVATGQAYVATLRYLILSGVGSVLTLVGITLIYGQTGTLNLAHLALLAPDRLDSPLGLGAFVLILIGVGIKAELFPVNTWVPEVYATASSRVSAILAGLVSKLAVLVIVRLLVLVFHQPEALQLMLVLGMLGVISGELAAWRAKDMNRMLAYSSIGQLGVIFIAFSLPAGTGLYAGLALALHHMLIKPGLFMLAQRWGGSLQRLRGAGFVSPLAAGLFVLFSLSLIGVPPLPGFWAKFLLVRELAGQDQLMYLVALLAFLAATVVEASYLFRVAAEMFRRREAGDKLPPAPAQEPLSLATSALIGAALLVTAVAIGPIGDELRDTATQAGDVAVYVSTVFPQSGRKQIGMMTPLDELLLFSGATVLVALLLGRTKFIGWVLTIMYAGQLLGLVKLGALGHGAEAVTASWQMDVMGQTLYWRLDALGWYFSIITVAAALLGSWYSAGEWGETFRRKGGNFWLFHVALAMNVLSMLALLASGDLLSLFIGWELVSWSGFLLMALGGTHAVQAAMRYITYAMIGAMAIFGGLGLIYSATGSLQYEAVIATVSGMGAVKQWVLMLLFAVGFGIKMGLLPFHLWQAPAYAETPGPGSAFLGAISSRMGLFAIVLVLIKLFGIISIESLKLPFTQIDARDVLAWVAAFTIILPTYTAMKQNDARYLLAWHGIGQGGYMLLGLVVANSLGGAGGLLHVLNYAACQAALLMAVFAVVHRTGTADLNKMGGLVTRMPLSFLVLLVGIIGLAGLPPMNGFVSKWLVYRSLLDQGMPLLFLASIIGTLGTILSVYKLIHNMFLGQLRVEHEHIQEAPWSMMVPMLILATIVFVTGLLPGIPLAWVSSALHVVGLPVPDYTLGGVESASGSLDMIWIIGVLFAGFGVGAVIFYFFGGPSKRVHQLDNYAGGHFLSADVRYQYSDNFYAGLMHLIGPWYRGSFQWMEGAVKSATEFLSMVMHGLYRRANAEFYLLTVALLAVAWVVAR